LCRWSVNITEFSFALGIRFPDTRRRQNVVKHCGRRLLMNYVKLIRTACHGDGDNADSKVRGVGVYTCGATRAEVTAPDSRLSIMRAPQGLTYLTITIPAIPALASKVSERSTWPRYFHLSMNTSMTNFGTQTARGETASRSSNNYYLRISVKYSGTKDKSGKAPVIRELNVAVRK